MAKCIIFSILTHSEQITWIYTLRNPVPVGLMFDLLRLDVLFCIKMRSKIEKKANMQRLTPVINWHKK